MRNSKIFSMILILGLLAFSIVGCQENSNIKGIYNNNDRIADQGDSYSFGSRVGNGNEEVIEIEYARFTGSDTILRIKSEVKGEVKFDFDSKLEKGKFKAVIIIPSGEVVTMLDHDWGEKEQGTYTLNVEPGIYRVKIVGDNASGEFKLDTELEQGMELLR